MQLAPGLKRVVKPILLLAWGFVSLYGGTPQSFATTYIFTPLDAPPGPPETATQASGIKEAVRCFNGTSR